MEWAHRGTQRAGISLLLIFFVYSTGMIWKLWTILQNWLCFHIIETCLQFKINKYFIKTVKKNSLKTREHEVVYRGNIVPCNNTIMWKHNQFCNIVQSFQFMPVEFKQNKRWGNQQPLWEKKNAVFLLYGDFFTLQTPWGLRQSCPV